MKQNPLRYAAAAVLLGSVVGLALHAARRESAATRAARAFLAVLPPEKATKVRFPFASEERFNWHFVPKSRNGLCFKEMTAEEQKSAWNLLRAGLSADGVKRLETIRQLEDVLHALERGTGPTRDPDLYFVTVFGEPSDRGLWAWRYEGHHISLQWTVRDGKVIADTPQFVGANPAEVREGPMKGTRLLAREEDLAYDLLRSLSEPHRRQAILSANAPADILTGNARRAARQEDRGVAFADLTPVQRRILRELVARHASIRTPEGAKQRLDRADRAGWDRVRFAWMGGLEPGQGHYYRIQGPTFLIEFDNTQNDANHIHTVWRDFNGDFGVDLLAEHYRTSPHLASTNRP
ncbi:MAG: DUF3500 domain-containing protein [Capsulimonadales bacterium]|nr:DUF3500 domain-containing protein [Capsulimonadales bacterium]